MHVHNANSFLYKTMRIVDGTDLTPFQDLTIHEMHDILPMGKDKEMSMIIMVYILLLRSESKVADLILTLIDSDAEILQTLFRMIERDEWPKSFSGHNHLQFVARKENDFLRTYIGSLTLDPKMRLVSTKISSPFVSIFQVIRKVVEVEQLKSIRS